MEELIGQLFNGYEIHKLIGKGPTGFTYLAKAPGPNSWINLKLIRTQISEQPGFLQTFQELMQKRIELKAPHIQKVLGYGEEHGYYYYISPYIDGTNLLELSSKKKAALSITQILHIFRDICESLYALHQQNAPHLNLKPENILLEPIGRQKFKLYIAGIGIGSLDQNGFLQQIQKGAPAYYPIPSEIENFGAAKADAYAMGNILYQILTGQTPLPLSHNTGKGTQFLVSVRAMVPHAPQHLDSLVRRLLSPEPSRRPHDFRQVMMVLDQIMSGLDVREAREEYRRGNTSLLRVVQNNSQYVQTEYFIHVGYQNAQLGQVYELKEEKMVIGRVEPAEITLDKGDGFISRKHCQIERQNGDIFIRDLNSTNGSFLDNQQLAPGELTPWPIDSTLKLGHFILTLKEERWSKAAFPGSSQTQTLSGTGKLRLRKIKGIRAEESKPAVLVLGDEPLTLGRVESCDMVFKSSDVSGYHCQVRRAMRGVEVIDLESTNGTFINGKRLPANIPVLWDGKAPLYLVDQEVTVDLEE